MYEDGLKSWYDIISAVDDFSDIWDPSAATSMEEVFRLEREQNQKMNLVWSRSRRVSWSVCELFSQPSYFH